MSTWGSGYVTDIAYTPGWYRQQSPSIMSLACLLGCVASPMPAGDDEVHYLELGCGYGYTAMLLAACNPAWRVTAVDYHPTHIAAARELLDEAVNVGRKLDFLCQEFNREANTLCSKSADLGLTRLGLSLKAAIEQLREQVQNIE